MDLIKRKFSLRIILIAFVILLFILTILSNPQDASDWPLLLLVMAYFGLLGALLGVVLGAIIGLISKLFKKRIFIAGLKYGAAIGFMGALVLWYLGCWLNGSICLPQ